MKTYIFLAMLLFINISCRTDTDINDVVSTNYISSLQVYNITSPAEGETWVPGRTHQIVWSSITNKPVDISVIKKKEYFETVIVTGLQNSGSYTWRVSEDIPLSNHYQIKISEHGNNSNSGYSGVFYIR